MTDPNPCAAPGEPARERCSHPDRCIHARERDERADDAAEELAAKVLAAAGVVAYRYRCPCAHCLAGRVWRRPG